MEECNRLLSEAKEKILKAFATTKKRDINFAYQIYILIKSMQNIEERYRLLQYLCEAWGTIDSSDDIQAPVMITDIEFEKLRYSNENIVEGLLVSYINRGTQNSWDRETFYKNLWVAIENNPSWDTDAQKTYAIFTIAIDFRSPYFLTGPRMKMCDEDYSKIQDKILENYQEFLFINALNYDQKTEKASLILNLFMKIETKEERVVLISKIITHFERREQRILDRLRGVK